MAIVAKLPNLHRALSTSSQHTKSKLPLAKPNDELRFAILSSTKLALRFCVECLSCVACICRQHSWPHTNKRPQFFQACIRCAVEYSHQLKQCIHNGKVQYIYHIINLSCHNPYVLPTPYYNTNMTYPCFGNLPHLSSLSLQKKKKGPAIGPACHSSRSHPFFHDNHLTTKQIKQHTRNKWHPRTNRNVQQQTKFTCNLHSIRPCIRSAILASTTALQLLSPSFKLRPKSKINQGRWCEKHKL